MKASFYIDNKFIEAFTFNPDDITVQTIESLRDHSHMFNHEVIESIIHHMIDDDMGMGEEVIYPWSAYETSGDLKIILTNK